MTSRKDVDEVLKWEHDGCAAYERNDAATIQHMVADGYVLTNSRGDYDTKADDMKVRIFENTAIVTGTTIVKGVAKDGSKVDAGSWSPDTCRSRRPGRD